MLVYEDKDSAVSVGALIPTLAEPEPKGDAVQLTRACFPAPAFGSAWRPRSVLSRRGIVSGIGRALPLQETTSAAYGVGRDSVANVTAVGCPVSAFIATTD